MFDAINRLWHKVCDNLHYPIETKKQSLHQYHDDRVYKKIGFHGAIGVHIYTIRNDCAIFIFKKKFGQIMPPLHKPHYTVSHP